jgi:hypothetical protein
MTVPKKYSARLPDGAPILRSSQSFPVRRSVSRDDASSTDSSDTSDAEQSRSYESADSLLVSKGMHTHTLKYITTRQPQSPATYSRLRRTCIRTLSTEVLPSSNKSSGPMVFGDSVAGHTIAYVFRLQDPRSRGAKRTYALIAMAGRDVRRATKAMVKILQVFEGIASRITALAERVLERESTGSHSLSRPTTAIPSTPPLGTSASSMPPVLTSPQKERYFSSAASSPTRNITPVSSFLSAKRLDPDGFPRVSRDVMKAKSLIEIVGQESFFLELHTLFCNLLHSLIKQYG